MASQVMTGARAIVYVDDVIVGIFDSCNYTSNIGVETQHTLGRFGPQENTAVSYEAVAVQCTGFRIVGKGGHVLPKFPKLQDLLNLEEVKLDVVDRRGGSDIPIMSVVGCIPANYGTGYNAKTSSRISITYIGTKVTDEEGEQDEQNAAAF